MVSKPYAEPPSAPQQHGMELCAPLTSQSTSMQQLHSECPQRAPAWGSVAASMQMAEQGSKGAGSPVTAQQQQQRLLMAEPAGASARARSRGHDDVNAWVVVAPSR